MIHANFMGHLGRDAELRETGSQKVLVFSVAKNDKRWGTDITTWVKCSLWGPRAEDWAKRLKKGVKVFVTGTLTLDTYTGKNGKTSNLAVNVQHIELAGASQMLAEDAPDTTGAAEAAPATTPPAANFLEDDVPF